VIGDRFWERCLQLRRLHAHRGYVCFPLKFCCDQMRDAWADDFVVYGDYGHSSRMESQLSIYQA